jgi:5-(carboxyamino)imidazole ribonucleotide synthase
MSSKEYQIGILGGGQLARMSIMAAQRMGIRAISLDSDSNSPAAQVGAYQVGSIHDPLAISALMNRCDFITFENEFILGSALREACNLASFEPRNVVPGIESLETIQDKLLQRQAYSRHGAPTPHAVHIDEIDQLGYPCVLKARYGGYDGKGTLFVDSKEEFEIFNQQKDLSNWLAEEKVPFRRELAVMVATSTKGYLTFPAMITEQKNYVCDLVYPCKDQEIAEKAQRIAVQAVESIRGQGLFGVELFETFNGEVLINEIAPRPHNSGHYTLDWGGTTQFEAHLLSVLGWLTNIETGADTCMANLLGFSDTKSYTAGLKKLIEEFPEAKMHWYGKADAKQGRKMGHLNVSDSKNQSISTLVETSVRARAAFETGWRA